jgi:crossover junction endodeoxyribonuclease RuvC
MKILGIDPGSTLIGFGVITEQRGELSFVRCGVLTTKSKDPLLKLKEVNELVTKLLDEERPELVGLEKLYFSKNKKTALEVAQARGVIASLLLTRGIPVCELGPGTVKVSLTNDGRADKQMVEKMVKIILKTPLLEGDDNASDALAVAIAAYSHNRIPR